MKVRCSSSTPTHAGTKIYSSRSIQVLISRNWRGFVHRCSSDGSMGATLATSFVSRAVSSRPHINSRPAPFAGCVSTRSAGSPHRFTCTNANEMSTGAESAKFAIRLRCVLDCSSLQRRCCSLVDAAGRAASSAPAAMMGAPAATCASMQARAATRAPLTLMQGRFEPMRERQLMVVKSLTRVPRAGLPGSRSPDLGVAR